IYNETKKASPVPRHTAELNEEGRLYKQQDSAEAPCDNLSRLTRLRCRVARFGRRAERLTAAACRGRIRIMDRESAPHAGLLEVDLETAQILHALRVDNDRKTVHVELLVIVMALIVEAHAV